MYIDKTLEIILLHNQEDKIWYNYMFVCISSYTTYKSAMQHKSALNLSSFRWKFLHQNSERYVWNSALDVPNCRHSFRFTRIHIFSILSVDIWIDKVGIMNDSFMCVIYDVHLKIANLCRYSIGLPVFLIVYECKVSKVIKVFLMKGCTIKEGTIGIIAFLYYFVDFF